MRQRILGKSNIILPEIGFGGAAIGNLYQKISDNEAFDAIKTAIECGFDYIDTAPHYGQGLSERRIGTFFVDNSKKPIISTKVGRILKPIDANNNDTVRHGFEAGDPFEPVFDYTYDGIMKSFEESKKRLKLDYIPIILVHDIGTATHGSQNDKHLNDLLNSGVNALRELKETKQIGAIGLGVNECEICEYLLDYIDLDVILLAGRYTLLEQNGLNTLFPKCKKLGTSFIIGGPFNSGLLIDGATKNNRPFYNYEPASDEIIAKVRDIENACLEFNIPLSAAALQFPLLNPNVISVIPGMANPKQVLRTKELYEIKIPSELWQSLQDKNIISQNAPIRNNERI